MSTETVSPSPLDGLLMTLADVAELADVQRPVVTVWRSRPSVDGEEIAFPEPAAHLGGVGHYRVGEIVAWLERTGRGNNDEARADAAAHARLPETAGEVDACDAAAALLCLRAVTGQDLAGLDEDDLVDLADELDPDDTHLFGEVESLGTDVTTMATYVDSLVDAAYGLVGALERVEARRGPGDASMPLSSQARDVVGELGAGIATALGDERVSVIDPTASGTDLVGAVLRSIGETLDATVAVTGDVTAARHARRTHLIHGWPLTTQAGAAVVVARFPHPGRPAMTPSEVLDAIDDVQLEMTDDQRAIILGPAGVLCDDLRDADLEAQRDQLVRLGRLRCAVRLPQGLLPGSVRQALGLWVLGPDPATRPRERWVSTADLSGRELRADVIDDLVTDVVASLDVAALGAGHAFRFARLARTAPMLAASGPLVPVGVQPSSTRVVHPAGQAVAAQDLATQLGMSGDVHVEPGQRPAGMPSTPLAAALADRGIRLVRGARIDDALVHGRGSVVVVRPADLLSEVPVPSGRVDPIEVEERHPRARRTEAGDVVFCASPRPRAWVDQEGMSVVQSPLRVLRCDPESGFVPEVVAWAVNALPDDARHWRTWPIPMVDPADGGHLRTVMRRLASERATAYERIGRLDRLAEVIVTGTSERAISVAEGGA